MVELILLSVLLLFYAILVVTFFVVVVSNFLDVGKDGGLGVEK